MNETQSRCLLNKPKYNFYVTFVKAWSGGAWRATSNPKVRPDAARLTVGMPSLTKDRRRHERPAVRSRPTDDRSIEGACHAPNDVILDCWSCSPYLCRGTRPREFPSDTQPCDRRSRASAIGSRQRLRERNARPEGREPTQAGPAR
jgi:hypothetical protein